ncbi:3-oxoacyl-[acyl-carrier protein] reductase [Sporobacter termitidis DSM 10068]|uniref:3-oxoacyl-[acyl-carrier protein] reductase n=1 Tax=Sporobacter termitidis DSM 10068 TaxID=1123282 RepID=A0A1M5YJK9_9FIRM|nr:SDR family oxidoreductase [Sporobacter termitidis]SHI12195.1 3-oxoacyl-[acyl-carrier protein] reductase [Sporobacter termitidis DSM 10068]
MAQYLDYGFQGRAAIITGAGTGIGRSCAVELAKGGAKVALFGRRAEKIQETLAECLQYTDRAMALSVDVSDETAVKDGVGKVLKAFGKADILINDAGIESRLRPGQTFFGDLFDALGPEEYLKFFKIHALGHYLMNLAVIPDMQKNHFGRIVNVTSVTGVNGAYSTPGYTASKAAAICQTKAFAKKYGKDNIAVNSIAPGMVDTPMKIDATPEEYAAVAGITPLGRVAQPVDIARAAMFFAQENLFVTGQNLIVDGGSNI